MHNKLRSYPGRSLFDPSDPKRDADLEWFQELSGAFHARVEHRQLETLQAGLQTIIHRMEDDQKTRDDDPAAAKPAAGLATSQPKLLSQDSPEVPHDAHLEDFARESEKRSAQIDRGHQHDPRPFDVRLNEARLKARRTIFPDDFVKSVVSYGLQTGLFAQDEEDLVEQTLSAPLDEARHRETEREKREAQWRGQVERENLVAGMQGSVITSVALGGIGIFPRAAGAAAFANEAVKGATLGFAIGDTTNQAAEAASSGRPEDVVGVAVPLLAGLAMHETFAAGTGEPAAERSPVAPAIETAETLPHPSASDPPSSRPIVPDSPTMAYWPAAGGIEPAPSSPDVMPRDVPSVSIGAAIGGESRLLWGRWEDYPKVKIRGRDYAKIGERLYTDHAVERMGPAGTAPSAQNPSQSKLERPKTADDARDTPYQRRGVSPTFVEYVIEYGTPRTTTGPRGEVRIIHSSGTVDVITENEIVITIETYSRRK